MLARRHLCAPAATGACRPSRTRRSRPGAPVRVCRTVSYDMSFKRHTHSRTTLSYTRRASSASSSCLHGRRHEIVRQGGGSERRRTSARRRAARARRAPRPRPSWAPRRPFCETGAAQGHHNRSAAAVRAPSLRSGRRARRSHAGARGREGCAHSACGVTLSLPLSSRCRCERTFETKRHDASPRKRKSFTLRDMAGSVAI